MTWPRLCQLEITVVRCNRTQTLQKVSLWSHHSREYFPKSPRDHQDVYLATILYVLFGQQCVFPWSSPLDAICLDWHEDEGAQGRAVYSFTLKGASRGGSGI